MENRAVQSGATYPHAAKVYLVGAGPGDPKLITLRGIECLAKADLVIYDYLVNPHILKHARQNARLLCAGRHGPGQGRILSQAEINQQMVQAAIDGKTVVRLKGGDPIVFARIAEEIAALQQQAIGYEVVPGITAALAAGSYAGIPLTHRDMASAVALVTGHERPGKSLGLDYQGLARFPGTLIFYMGVTTVAEWSAQLIQAGKPGETPVAIVRRCSWPDQEVERCQLSTVAEIITQQRIRPPVLCIVGQVAASGPIASWFAERPLFGKQILIARPPEQAEEMLAQLTELGASCVVHPVIETGPPPDWAAVDLAIEHLPDYDWLVFASATGVNAFMERVFALGKDLRWLAGVKIAVVGSSTANAVKEYRLNPDLMPEVFRAEALAESLIAQSPTAKYLLIRASRGRDILRKQLTEAGGQVTQVSAYNHEDVEHADPEVLQNFAMGAYDWVTVTSSATARSLVRLYGKHLSSAKLASISPITTEVLNELGYQSHIEAGEYTSAGVIAGILEAESRFAKEE